MGSSLGRAILTLPARYVFVRFSQVPSFSCQVSHWYILYLFTLRATVPTSVYTNLFTGLQQVTEQAFSRGYLNTSLLKSLYKQAGACLLASRS
jgi:hypothetical protein